MPPVLRRRPAARCRGLAALCLRGCLRTLVIEVVAPVTAAAAEWQHDAARYRNGQQDNGRQAARSLPMLQSRLLHGNSAGPATTSRGMRSVDGLQPVAV